MYNSFFGLRESPFSIAPNPRYLYMSEQHRDAFAHLHYGVQARGGFVMLSGEVGAGKTTLCRSLLHQLPPKTDVAYIFNPAQTSVELYIAICEELAIKLPDQSERSSKLLQSLIYQHLLEAHSRGRNTLLIIDEAQSLPLGVIEQLRLLTNLETDDQKLLQIILLGQPELRDLIADPSLKQLSQRITARFHLGPLGKEDVLPYIQHRLTTAGANGQLFDPHVCQQIYNLSKGVPRLINVICDRALLAAYTRNSHQITDAILEQAAHEALGTSVPIPKRKPEIKKVAAVALVTAGVAGVVLFSSVNLFTTADSQETSGSEAIQQPTNEAEMVAATDSAQPLIAKTESNPDKANSSTALNSSTKAINPVLASKKPTAPPKAAQVIKKDEYAAYKVLLQLWQISSDGFNDDPCRFVAQQGLRCLHDTGTLAQLEQLNRPALIRVKTDKGIEEAALTTLTAKLATVIIGRQVLELTPEQLRKQWDGSFTLFWRPPPNYRAALRAGETHKSVSWLKKQLVNLTSAPLDIQNQHFNSKLEFWVKTFQRSRGLDEDGIVGPLTLIHLNSVTSSKTPLLSQYGG